MNKFDWEISLRQVILGLLTGLALRTGLPTDQSKELALFVAPVVFGVLDRAIYELKRRLAGDEAPEA